MSRGQLGGSLQPYPRFSRPEPLLFQYLVLIDNYFIVIATMKQVKPEES
jgi:hypothetical protein